MRKQKFVSFLDFLFPISEFCIKFSMLFQLILLAHKMCCHLFTSVISHSIFYSDKADKKYSRDFGDISEILSELNLRTMRRNNG